MPISSLVGVAVGSITGSLIGLGVPEIQGKAYEGKVKNGSALVSVHTTDEEQITTAKRTFQVHGAEDISSTGEASLPADDTTKLPTITLGE